MTVSPMFPLGQALLPGAILPLHVFEPRYRQMMRDILAADDRPPEFGVTMIERGWEVGGGDERSDVGTMARIFDMQVTDDGRYAVMAAGVRRIRIETWLPDDPYPVADVVDWHDEGEPSIDVERRIDELRRRVADLNELGRELGDDTPEDAEISSDPTLAVYHLGSLAPIGASDRYRLLMAPSLDERIDALTSALDDAAAVLEFRRS